MVNLELHFQLFVVDGTSSLHAKVHIALKHWQRGQMPFLRFGQWKALPGFTRTPSLQIVSAVPQMYAQLPHHVDGDASHVRQVLLGQLWQSGLRLTFPK